MKPKPTSEAAFESVIEDHLLDAGFQAVAAAEFDRERAVFPEVVLDFIRSTQPKEWAKLEALHGEKTGEQVLTDLCKWMDVHGSLATLRHGFKCYGRILRVAFFKAAHELKPELEERYAANRLGITRQLHFSMRSEKSLDVALSLNGIPIGTVELKNPLTGQTVDNAMGQYRHDRDPREPIFDFKKRSLVHFAADTEVVFMTTRLAGTATHFLPFNKGDNGGAGNPPDPAGQTYRTAYLWEEVLQRDSLLDLLARFLHLQVEEKRGEDGRKVLKETMIFPRYHQLGCVRGLVDTARHEGPGYNSLIDQSAGPEDRSHGGALPRSDLPQDRRTGQGDGGHGLAAGGRALQAKFRHLHRQEGLPDQIAGGFFRHRSGRQAQRGDSNRSTGKVRRIIRR